MELRLARPADAPWIGDYHHRCWIEGYAGLIDQHVLDGLRVGDRVARWERVLHDEPETPVVVAVVSGVPVGHVQVAGDTIANLYVDPRCWGRGIGRRLLAAGEDLLRCAGHDRGVLWVIVGNARAFSLYSSGGWAPDGTVELHDSSAGVPVEEQRMAKDLGGEPARR